jgi:hypothetical protein
MTGWEFFKDSSDPYIFITKDNTTYSIGRSGKKFFWSLETNDAAADYDYDESGSMSLDQAVKEMEKKTNTKISKDVLGVFNDYVNEE